MQMQTLVNKVKTEGSVYPERGDDRPAADKVDAGKVAVRNVPYTDPSSSGYSRLLAGARAGSGGTWGEYNSSSSSCSGSMNVGNGIRGPRKPFQIARISSDRKTRETKDGPKNVKGIK